jgi:hypothetical protein
VQRDASSKACTRFVVRKRMPCAVVHDVAQPGRLSEHDVEKKGGDAYKTASATMALRSRPWREQRSRNTSA